MIERRTSWKKELKSSPLISTAPWSRISGRISGPPTPKFSTTAKEPASSSGPTVWRSLWPTLSSGARRTVCIWTPSTTISQSPWRCSASTPVRFMRMSSSTTEPPSASTCLLSRVRKAPAGRSAKSNWHVRANGKAPRNPRMRLMASPVTIALSAPIRALCGTATPASAFRSRRAFSTASLTVSV